MSKRKSEAADDNEMAATAQKTATTETTEDFKISKETPLADYRKLIETRVAVDEVVDDDVTKENFKKTAAAAREIIWQLLFTVESAADAESQKKAAELLEEYKGDACFYGPWPYNEWIVTLRDELLKREQLDFWRETIVKSQLGPCWFRDSDLFDGDDEPPLEFYAHAGCVAPFAASLKVRAAEIAAGADEPAGNESELAASNAAALTGDFEANISKEQPLQEYRELMKRYVVTKLIVSDDVHKQSVDKIAKAARSAIWQLLFEGTPTQSEFEKAAELLQEYKGDACFYGPWNYNEWIVKLRDELLQRELLEFWSEKIVKLELGPCCARDSDYFESDDAIPVEFYEKAGCKAPFEAHEK